MNEITKVKVMRFSLLAPYNAKYGIEEGERIENTVNDFASSHEIIDIKVNTFCGEFANEVLYTIMYRTRKENLTADIIM